MRRLKGIEEPVALYRVTPDRAAADAHGRQSLAGRAAAAPRRMGIALVAAIIVAVGLAGVVGLGALRGMTTAPSPGPTGSTSGAPTAEPSPGAAEATFPSPQERELLSRLPSNVSGDNQCHTASAAEATAGAIASIHCDLPVNEDATYVIYERLPGAFELATAFTGLQQAHDLKKGDCAKQPAAWGDWGLEGIFTGEALCFPGAGNRAWIAWTYEGHDILARATRDNDDWHRLYTWWKPTAEELRG
jgi:hypothetical protein